MYCIYIIEWHQIETIMMRTLNRQLRDTRDKQIQIKVIREKRRKSNTVIKYVQQRRNTKNTTPKIRERKTPNIEHQ